MDRSSESNRGGRTWGRDDLVALDAEHPGFRDRQYRERRNAIARLALEYRPGDPVPRAEYTQEEQELWRIILRELAPLHARYACRQSKHAVRLLPLSEQSIPQLEELNARLEPLSGFRMEPVAGLISAREFLRQLGRGVFLSTQYIRHVSKPLYTPEPDVVHELVGHASSLAHPLFAELSRAFGAAAERCVQDDDIAALERLYWYTLEYGVVREARGLAVYGAGLLSSYGELQRFEQHADLRPFRAEEVAHTPYDPTDYQPVLFVAESFDSLSQQLLAWLDQSSGVTPP